MFIGSNTSGAAQPLDILYQRLFKTRFRQIQKHHQLHGPDQERKTKYGKAKAAPAYVQADFMQQLLDEQCNDITKWATSETFEKSCWALDPEHATPMDECAWKHLRGKDHAKLSEPLRLFNRAPFVPMALSFNELMDELCPKTPDGQSRVRNTKYV